MNAAPIPLDDDADIWARIRTCARWLVIEDADLDDESDCWRCLIMKAIPAKVARHCVGEAIVQARVLKVQIT